MSHLRWVHRSARYSHKTRKNERVGESGRIKRAEAPPGASPPRRRAQLERLFRHVCRPPTTQERLG